jgi:hypothetical protein
MELITPEAQYKLDQKNAYSNAAIIRQGMRLATLVLEKHNIIDDPSEAGQCHCDECDIARFIIELSK